jgi:anti-anti-sigma factor
MISFKKEENSIVCIPQVNMVASNVSAMRDRILSKIESLEWQELIVDCSEVDTLDSIGVNLVVGLFKKAESTSSQFKMTGCNDAIKKVLNLFRLDQKFSVE